MPVISRGGFVENLSVQAGQSVMIGSFGPGVTRLYTAAATPSNMPPVTAPNASVSGGSLLVTFATAQTVRIEASYGCEAEYVIGAQPVLSAMPSSYATGVVAKAGGGQALATALTANNNRITTCATAGDSVILGAATPGASQSVFNAGAASMNVFPAVGEAIGVGAVNAAFAVPAGKGAQFTCSAQGVWNSNLSA